ncbi:alcohol dehydrogenase [Guyanagaster necrorhizus]|uniref:Alcohol dehydrogenase n=1 Tax=Guyanagaster necrorhizus TaxID=856835 RepID=A0A9P8AX33_9AGAR|nr:alcohol dehydrogenase [Guyanagaster necrorhizus MCA 3950]KAG7449512.1 alcohol dehydrogenase [Guyanagaster necrorhizus MCA 3950]
MRGVLVSQLSHPSKIPPSVDVPEPTLKKNEVLVDVYSAGLNFFDILQMQGKYQRKPPLPFVAGAEFAGRIAKDSPIPKGCPYRPGDRVFGATQGAFADKAPVSWKDILPLPDALSYEQGAGLYVTWPTSYEALVGRAQLKAGEWVLVTAAAGGVGIVAVQLAKVLGANVIAAAGSQEKLDIAKQYGGADYTVNYTDPNWPKEVLKMTNGHGADVIYDPVGLIKGWVHSLKRVFWWLNPPLDSLKCIAWKGRALIIGFAAGTIEKACYFYFLLYNILLDISSKIPMNLVLLKNVSIVGTHWGAYTTQEPGHIPTVWKAVLDLLSSGRVSPVNYTEVYTLETIRDGLAALENRKTWGKAIVRVKDETEKAKL